MTTDHAKEIRSNEGEAPERIWLLKSVVALLGTNDFIVPPAMREHAFEYVRVAPPDPYDGIPKCVECGRLLSPHCADCQPYPAASEGRSSDAERG